MSKPLDKIIEYKKEFDSSIFIEEDDAEVSGASATVKKYRNKQDNQYYCVKIFNQEYLENHKYKNNAFKREYFHLYQANNPAVLSLYSYKKHSKPFKNRAIIITKCYSNVLNKYIKRNKPFNPSERYIFILGIAKGMEYLHSINIAHRDLKPDNIFFDDDLHPVIGDLGLSREADEEMGSNVGTYAYMAPEIFNNGVYNKQVDVFSFSIVFYEIYTWAPPYPNYDNQGKLYDAVREEGLRPNLQKIPNKLIKDFLVKCWDEDPNKRPTFQKILETIKSKDFRKAMGADDNKASNYLKIFGDTLNSIPINPSVIKQQADSGQIDKIIEYADMLLAGHLVAQNDNEALKYYKKAADMKNTYSMQMYAVLLLKKFKDKQHKKEAAELLKEALTLFGDYQNREACYEYAKMLYDGKIIDKNIGEAFVCFKKAADSLYCPAFSRIAMMYYYGEGTQADQAKALVYLNYGQVRNDPDSLICSAILKLNSGYSNNDDVANFFRKAANSNNVNANLFYATILSKGYFGVQIDTKAASRLIKEAEKENSEEAAELSFKYALMISENKISKFKPDDAKLFFKNSAEKNNPEAIIKYVSLMNKQDALNFLRPKMAFVDDENVRDKYCELCGPFYQFFNALEKVRIIHDIDLNRHVVSVIVSALSNENRAKLINELKKETHVRCIRHLACEIMEALKFVYPNDYTSCQDVVNRALNEKLTDSDLA